LDDGLKFEVGLKFVEEGVDRSLYSSFDLKPINSSGRYSTYSARTSHLLRPIHVVTEAGHSLEVVTKWQLPTYTMVTAIRRCHDLKPDLVSALA
jgi:hypothetical protein